MKNFLLNRGTKIAKLQVQISKYVLCVKCVPLARAVHDVQHTSFAISGMVVHKDKMSRHDCASGKSNAGPT